MKKQTMSKEEKEKRKAMLFRKDIPNMILLIILYCF